MENNVLLLCEDLARRAEEKVRANVNIPHFSQSMI